MQSYINYQYLIQLSKEELKKRNYEKADYYLYLSLLSPNVNLLSYIAATSLRSYVYLELKDIKMLLYLSSKIIKLFPLIIDQVNDIKAINDIVLVLSRAGISLFNNDNSAYSNVILPFYLLSASKRLIKKKQASIDDNYKEYFNSHYKIIKSKLSQELNNIKQSYYDILTLNGEEFRKEEKKTLYTVVSELIDESNYNKVIHSNEKEHYIISNKWLKRYKEFLGKLNSFKDSPSQYNQFLNKGFGITLQYFNFIEEDIKKYDCPYINSINNYWIEQFKDSWIEKDDEGNDDEEKEKDYTDVYLKSFISLEEFSVLNKTQWEELAKNFGYVNQIKRFSMTNGEIEIHLKRIKVMVLNKQISTGKINRLRPKTIQLSKENTISDLVSKIKKCLNNKNKKGESIIYNIYKIDLSSMNIFERKQLIFEIMICYVHSNNSINLKCEKIIQMNKTIDVRILICYLKSVEDKCLIIIEELPSISKSNHFIREIDSDSKKCCFSLCNKTHGLSKCSKCRVNLINSYWYCSKDCETTDIDHLSYHTRVSNYFILKTNINDLKGISIKSIISNHLNSKQGKVIIKNITNTTMTTTPTPTTETVTSNVLLLLAHCQELTKYVLSKRYLNEINGSDQSKLLAEYNKIVNSIWKGTELIINADDFINSLTKVGYDNKVIHDSYAFLCFLLNVLHKNFNRVINRPKIKGNRLLSLAYNKSAIEISNYYWGLYKEKEDSLIIDLFYGQLKTKSMCSNCRESMISYTPFNSFSLNIPVLLSKVKFLFFPLLNNEKGSDINLVYYQYEVTINKLIKARNFLSVIIDNNPHLTMDTIEVDYMLLKPNKQFDQLITIADNTNDDISYLYNDLNVGYLLLLYQKTNSIKNIYVYPCEFITKHKFYFIPYTDINYLSFPFSLQLTNDAKVNDLYALIKKILKRLFLLSHIKQSSYTQQFLSENDYFCAQDNELFRLFIYNSQQNEDEKEDSEGILWGYINNRSNKNSTICAFCGQHCLYCSFSNRFNQNESIEYILSHGNNTDYPFLLYAQLLSIDKNAKLFNNSYDNDNRGHSLSSCIEAKRDITLYDCLNLFFDEKQMNDSQCSKCFQTSEIFHQIDLVTPPLYLILHLENSSQVEYPQKDLDLSHYSIKELKSKVIYDLSSVIIIDSSMKSHFICEYFGEWLNLSDNEVTLTEHLILNGNAKILLYKRRQVD